MTFQSFEEPMTAEAFAAWSETVTGDARHELLDGRIYAMAAERVAHARAKNAVLRQLEREIEAKGLPCEAFPDGMAVRVDEANVFEPDVSVRCGVPLSAEAVLIEDPIIVVEVASPSTQRVDVLVKLARYFRNPAVRHYLIVVPSRRIVVRHSRVDDRIEATTWESGLVDLAPPGLQLDVGSLFPRPS